MKQMANAQYYPQYERYSAGTGLIILTLVITTFIGVYLQFSIGFPFSGFFLPSFLLFFCVHQRKRQFDSVVLLGMLGIALYIVVIARMPPAPAPLEQFKSLMQFLMSLVGGLALYRAMSIMSRRKVHRLFLSIALILLLGAILERIGPLKPISDSFRDMFYENTGYLSNSDARDIANTDFIRPKLFTSEPSHLGKFFGLFIALAALTALSLKRKIYLLLASLIGILTIGSPTVLAGMVLIFANIAKVIGPKRLIRNPLFIVFIIGVTIAIGRYIYFLSFFRLGIGGGPIEASAYIRLVRPWFILLDALTAHPFLGFGIGADSTLRQISIEASFNASAPLYVQEIAYDNFAYGNINLSIFWQFGLVGSFLWFYLIARMQLIFAPRKALEFWAFYAVYGFFVGSLNGPFLWMPLFLVLLSLSPRMQRRGQGGLEPIRRQIP